MALGIGSLQEQTNRAMTAYADNPQALDADINKAAKNPRISPDIAKLAAKSTMDKLLTSLENANLAASMPTPTPSISDQLDSSLRQRLENLINKNAPPTQNTTVGNAVSTLNNRTSNNKGIMGSSPQQGMNVPQGKQTPVPTPPLSQQVMAQRPAQGIMSAAPQQGMPTRMAAGGGVMKYAVGDMVGGNDFGASTPEMLANMTQEQLTALASSIGISVEDLIANISPVVNKGGNAETVTNLNTGKVTEELVAPTGINTVAGEPMPSILREVTDPKTTAPKGIETAVAPNTIPSQDAVSAPEDVEFLDLPAAALNWALDNPEVALSIGLMFIPGVGWGALAARGGAKALAAGVSRLGSTAIGKKAKEALLNTVTKKIPARGRYKQGEGTGKAIGASVDGKPMFSQVKTKPRYRETSPARRELDPQKLKNRASDAIQLGAGAALAKEILGGEDPVTPIVPPIDSAVLEDARDTNGDAAFEEVLKALQAERNEMATGNKGKRGEGGEDGGGAEELYIPPTEKVYSPDGRLLREAMVANTNSEKQASARLAALKASDKYYKRGEKDATAKAAAAQRQEVLDADKASGGDEFGALLRGLANTGPMQSPLASGARNLTNYRTTRAKDLQSRQEAIQDLIGKADITDTETAKTSDASAQNTLDRATTVLRDAATFVASLDRTEQSRLNTQSASRAQAIISGNTADRADRRAILSQEEAKKATAIARRFNVLIQKEANLQTRLDGIVKFKADYAASVRGSDYYQEQKRIKQANNPESSKRKEAEKNIAAADISIQEDTVSLMSFLDVFGTVEQIMRQQGVVQNLINKEAGIDIPPLSTGTGGKGNTTDSDNARVDSNVSTSLGE